MGSLKIIRVKKGKKIEKTIYSFIRSNSQLYDRYLTKVLGLNIVLDENMVLK
jgi:hypothetical protein